MICRYIIWRNNHACDRAAAWSYPAWQDWLGQHQPPLLVLWGRYDPSFQVEEGPRDSAD